MRVGCLRNNMALPFNAKFIEAVKRLLKPSKTQSSPTRNEVRDTPKFFFYNYGNYWIRRNDFSF